MLKQISHHSTEITLSDGKLLYSYNTPVAMFNNLENKYYKTNKKWSKTTSKHINSWIPKNAVVEEKDQDYFNKFVQEIKLTY